ncbi:MAG: radical SAM protein [Rickettsiales bacterium]|jgi:radical SAM superfamily enzyme YgiQ (UPF0313 family)|nr:radical SAM protein [Rickettsiales bacterium]
MFSKKLSKKKFLVGFVQINNSFADACYLPYTAGILQAYFQHHSSRAKEFLFLPPIYRRMSVNDAVRHLDGADVVALSVSTWNFKISLEIARCYKRLYPNALILMGGPQIPSDATTLLRTFTWVNLVCHGEGEIPLLKILEMWPKHKWSDIPSISYLEGERCVNQPGESRVSDLNTIPSPYLSGIFEPLLHKDQGHQWLGLWETNRGCPFSCTYCYWGATAHSKVYCFDMERLRCEIAWFSEHKIEFIFCCDANFGIFQRDMDIVLAIEDIKKITGFPKALSVQNAKNSNQSYKIQKALANAGLSKGVDLALQSMNPETLKLIGRQNIPSEMFQDLQQRYTKDGIETFTDIIIGLPGESYDSFTKGIEKIINNGQHNRIQFINLSILPNTQMANPAYREQHGLITVESKIINIHGHPTDYGDSICETQELVISNSTMSLEDWRWARVFAWMTSFLYFDKILQIPIMLLHATTGISYSKQIKSFIIPSNDRFPLIKKLTDFFITEAKKIQQGEPEFYYDSNWLDIYWPHDEYAYIHLSANNKLGAFYQEAYWIFVELLSENGYSCPPWLHEAIKINQALLKQPFHPEDLIIRLDHDLLSAYDTIRKTASGSIVRQTSHYIVFRKSEQWKDWLSWVREVVWFGNKRGAYLYHFDKLD